MSYAVTVLIEISSLFAKESDISWLNILESFWYQVAHLISISDLLIVVYMFPQWMVSLLSSCTTLIIQLQLRKSWRPEDYKERKEKKKGKRKVKRKRKGKRFWDFFFYYLIVVFFSFPFFFSFLFSLAFFFFFFFLDS